MTSSLASLSYSIRISLSIMLSVLFLPLPCSAEPPLTLKSCQARWTTTLKRHERRLDYAQRSLKFRFSQARTKLWLPKSPQLRGRLDQELEDPDSRGRVGLRWHLPKLSMSEPSPKILGELGLSEEKLPERWLRLKKHELWIESLGADLLLREAWLTQTALSYEERLSQAELTLQSQLLRDGLTSSIRLKTLRSRHFSLQLKLRRATRELKRLMIMAHGSVNGLTPLIAQHDTKELTTLLSTSVVDCLSPETLTSLQSSLSHESAHLSTSPLTLGEIELIIQLVMSRFKAQSNAHQWLEFVELSYDGRVGSERVIAELGLNLPLGPQRERAERLSVDELRETAQQLHRSLKRQRGSLRGLLSLEALNDLSQERIAQPHLSALNTLDELQLARAEVSHWRSAWSDRHHLERLVIEWLTLTPGLSASF